MDVAQHDRELCPGGSFQTRVIRRHVDLLRVSSALCPEKTAVH
ncbi:putative leader peptide [Streptomyces sp. IBSBF 2435]